MTFPGNGLIVSAENFKRDESRGEWPERLTIHWTTVRNHPGFPARRGGLFGKSLTLQRYASRNQITAETPRRRETSKKTRVFPFRFDKEE